MAVFCNSPNVYFSLNQRTEVGEGSACLGGGKGEGAGKWDLRNVLFLILLAVKFFIIINNYEGSET